MESSSHPVLDNESSDRRTDDPRDGADGVGHSHQDGGVLRRDVQVVDGESGPGETKIFGHSIGIHFFISHKLKVVQAIDS